MSKRKRIKFDIATFNTLVKKEIVQLTCSAKTHPFDVTTSLLQLCKGEDVTPCYRHDGDCIAMLAGDGHGGKECAQTIDANSSDILAEILANGVASGLAKADNLCSVADSGAMLVLLHYNRKTREMSIVNRGDASCTVYQGGEVVHQQRHHSYAVVAADQLLLQEAEAKGIRLAKNFQPNSPNMVPDPDGKTMHIRFGPSYFSFSGGGCQMLQGGSFMGHGAIVRLNYFSSNLTIPNGPFRVCMNSDGVSDVIHPEDAIMHAGTAPEILEEAYRRWCLPFFDETNVQALSNLNVGGHFIINQTETTTRKGPDGIVRRYNRGADDISAIVLSVHK